MDPALQDALAVLLLVGALAYLALRYARPDDGCGRCGDCQPPGRAGSSLPTLPDGDP